MRFKNHCFVEKCILYRQMKRYQRYYFLLPCKSIWVSQTVQEEAKKENQGLGFTH